MFLKNIQSNFRQTLIKTNQSIYLRPKLNAFSLSNLYYNPVRTFSANNDIIPNFIERFSLDENYFNGRKKQVDILKKQQVDYETKISEENTLRYFKKQNVLGFHKELLQIRKRNKWQLLKLEYSNVNIRKEVKFAKKKLGMGYNSQHVNVFKSQIASDLAIIVLLHIQLFTKISSLYNSDEEDTETSISVDQNEQGDKKKLKSKDESKSVSFMLQDLFKNDKNIIKPEQNIKTKFTDVQGIDEFKEELEELVDYLKHPKKYTDAGATIPKGILQTGAPGTGKTLMARALAGEANCSFFYKSGAEFEEIYVGVGAKRVRELFEKARKSAPSIIFIDEIDALASQRSSMHNSSMRGTINQILTEMDGFKQSSNIIVIGATNQEKSIDKAILRPGRFDKTINVPYPDYEGRKKILYYYLDKIKYDSESVNSDTLSKACIGFTGADIKNFVNLSILNAVKSKRKSAIHEDFEFAQDRVRQGTGRKRMCITEQEKLMTAYHEGGHTLVSLLTKGSLPLHKCTILPRGPSLGHTAFLPEKDLHNTTKEQLLARIDVALGGRQAEEMIYGTDEITTGCSSDLQQATNIAYQFIRRFGMGDTFMISAEKNGLSDKLNYEIDTKVQEILTQSLYRVNQVLDGNKGQLEILAKKLVEKETLSSDEIKKLIGI